MEHLIDTTNETDPKLAEPHAIQHDVRAGAIVHRRIRSAITQALFLAGDMESQAALDETLETELWDAIRDPQIAAALARIASHGVMLNAERADDEYHRPNAANKMI